MGPDLGSRRRRRLLTHVARLAAWLASNALPSAAIISVPRAGRLIQQLVRLAPDNWCTLQVESPWGSLLEGSSLRPAGLGSGPGLGSSSDLITIRSPEAGKWAFCFVRAPDEPAPGRC